MKTYDEILAHIVSAGSNSIEWFGGEKEGGYELQQVPTELAAFLYCLQKIRFKNYLEIGVAAGGMTRIMCDILDIDDVYTIDFGIHPSISSERNLFALVNNVAQLKCAGEYYPFIGDSHSKEAHRFLEESEAKFDLVFIDGDHTPEGVLADLMLIQHFLKPNAIIAIHDIASCDGPRALHNDIINGVYPELKVVQTFVSAQQQVQGIGVYEFKINK